MHTRSHSQLFLDTYAVILRGIRYIPNVANFELTEKNNVFKCLEVLIKYVHSGGTSKSYESV